MGVHQNGGVQYVKQGVITGLGQQVVAHIKFEKEKQNLIAQIQD